MSGVTADIPAAPDEPSGQATGNASVASAHTSDEAGQTPESTQHSKDTPTEEDVLNFIYGRSSSTDKPCTDVNSDDLDPYMTSPRATLGRTAQKPHDTSQDPSSFASFGDRGTTASVNAYGQIMQITKFLGAGRSGFLCADSWNTPEPYDVQYRAQELVEKSTSPYMTCVGAELPIMSDPRLDFICDRWPRFTGQSEGCVIQIQYYACHGTIFQQCVLEGDPIQQSLESQESLEGVVVLDSDILVRDLDWRDEEYSFNNASYGDKESYDTYLANDGFSLVRNHKGLDCGPVTGGSSKKDTDNTEPLDSTTVELVITAFLNGRPQRLKSLDEDGSDYCIDIPRETATAEFSKRGRLEITVAYKLQLSRKDGEDAWKSRLVPASHLTHMQEAFSARGFQDIQFSKNDQLDFAIRRNLEHILSVCCIPIPIGNPLEPDREAAKFAMDGNDESTALTCGDMSGHRLVSSASFFAFEFLISVHEFLRKELSTREHGDGYYQQVQDLAIRISNTCKAHILWVFKAALSSGDDQAFGSDYWASGRRIQTTDGRMPKFSSPESISDTAFQLIKAEEVYKMLTTVSTEKTLLEKWIKQTVDPWTARLNKAERRPMRGPYAFARSTDDVTGNDNYYLEDHVWIWKALRTIETIGREKTQTPKEQNRSRKEAATRDSGKTETAPRRYSSNEAQKQILKRFTSENTALKQRTRMLAVYRSSSEIRFMLRSRDTALFHCMNFHFFRTPESDNLVDVWKNTLAAQVNHEENEMTGWDTPLRYALALVMAIEGWKINQASTDKIFSEARRVLFESLWANGLFPGFLNYSDKKPEIFQDVDHRDNYWHTTFEVPYLLWKYAKKRLEQGADNKKDTNPASTNQLLKDGMDTKPDSQAQETNAVKVVMVAKKIMPFNNLINQKSIIEPPDEWLYNEPDFLNFVPDWNGFNLPLDDPSMHKIAKASENPMKNHVSRGTKIQLRDWIQLISDSIFRGEEPFLKMLETIEAECSTARESIPQQGSDENIKDVDRSILDRIPAKWKEEMRQLAKKFSSLPPNADPKNIIAEVMSKIDEIPFLSKGAIIDVKRWPRKDRKNKTPSDPLREARMLENEEILLRLTTQRTCPSDQNPADGRGESVVVKKRLIWLPLSDRVTAKICRHLTPASEKENMFSFFERHKTYDKFFFDDTTAASNTWKTELQLSFYEQYDQDHVLSRAAMGFRFDGDFFDRYWTCHFIEHKPKTEIVNININELSRILQREGNLPKTERGKQPWRQRKVLELILFDRIVEEIITSTDGIMRTIREELKDNTKSMRNTTKDSSYKSDNKHSSGEWVFRECSIWNMEESCHSAKPGETSSKDDALEDAIRAAKFVSNMKSEHYQSFSQKSQVLEQILRVLDDDLGESLEQIKRWERRDDDRAPEKPRWTRNDERRYRTTITKMLGSNDKKIRELEQCRSNVQSLKASLQSTREYIRDDLNLRSAEDVRLFTYVTATFLPISFATSIFSMGGSPGGALLGKMICVATVALLLTGIALVYDKKLAVIARHFRTFILYLISQGSRVIKASLRPLQVRKHSEKDDGDEEPKLANVLPSIFQRSRGGAGNDPAEAEKGVRKRHVQ